MSIDQFKWVNLLRHIEQTGPAELRNEVDAYAEPVESELRQSNLSFTNKVVSRASQVIDLLGLRGDFATFSQHSRSFSWILFGGMALLGFIAVMQTLSNESHTLNIYWLLLFLIGINAISMILWIVLVLRSRANSYDGIRSQSPLTRLYRKILVMTHRSGRAKSVLASWAELYLVGQIGKWFTSKNLHAAWLMYLAGGMLALVIALSGKQYDFVWGTTILGGESFVSITQALATLPSTLGFTVPSSEQVLLSRQGVSGTELDRESLRSAWAGFLFACILLYAVLPRLLLWLTSAYFLNRAESHYEPDWELPYFYRLRSRLLPESTSLGVVDEDQSSDFSLPQAEDVEVRKDIAKLTSYLSDDTVLIASYEWGTAPLPDSLARQNPRMINDLQTQQDFLSSLAASGAKAKLVVPLERAADRGAARFFTEVMRSAELTVLVVRGEQQESERARWAGWQALAERIKLPASKLILVEAP